MSTTRSNSDRSGPSTMKEAIKLLKDAGFQPGHLPGEHFKGGRQPWHHPKLRVQIELPKAGGGLHLEQADAQQIALAVAQVASA